VTLVRGSHALGAAVDATHGGFVVTFDQDVSACAYVATLTANLASAGAGGEIAATGEPEADSVLVRTFGSGGSETPHPFSIAVLC
jgi:hypothetical protein